MSIQSTGGVPTWDLTDRLHKALRHHDVSVQEMADVLEVNRKTVGNYLAGRTVPPASAVRVWAMRCGVSYDWLRYGRETDSPSPDGGSEQGGTPTICKTVDLPIDIASRRSVVTTHHLPIAN